MSGFLAVLRALAALFARFAETGSLGALRWDGTTYAPAAPASADPQAARWWGLLTSIEGMLADHDRLNAHQKQYLDRMLFGGMGSLNDFAFDENQIGPDARRANQELDALRRQLFDEFRRL